jgi:adenosine kinase
VNLKVFALNLSAPFIPQFFGAQLQQVLPYVDILISNESEAEAWASANGLADPKDLPAIAKTIALHQKANSARPRIVVITHGAESTHYVSSADSENVKVIPVHALGEEEIVDTNGAGDAFAGGFLGECVEAGHKMGAMNIKLIGPTYKWPKVQIL